MRSRTRTGACPQPAPTSTQHQHSRTPHCTQPFYCTCCPLPSSYLPVSVSRLLRLSRPLCRQLPSIASRVSLPHSRAFLPASLCVSSLSPSAGAFRDIRTPSRLLRLPLVRRARPLAADLAHSVPPAGALCHRPHFVVPARFVHTRFVCTHAAHDEDRRRRKRRPDTTTTSTAKGDLNGERLPQRQRRLR